MYIDWFCIIFDSLCLVVAGVTFVDHCTIQKPIPTVYRSTRGFASEVRGGAIETNFWYIYVREICNPKYFSLLCNNICMLPILTFCYVNIQIVVLFFRVRYCAGEYTPGIIVPVGRVAMEDNRTWMSRLTKRISTPLRSNYFLVRKYPVSSSIIRVRVHTAIG